MLHTLRSVVKNDALWFSTLKQFCLDFYHKNTNTAEVVNYFSNKLGAEIGPLMRYYLYQVELPTLAYQYNEGILKYKWKYKSLHREFQTKPHWWHSLWKYEVLTLQLVILAIATYDQTDQSAFFVRFLYWAFSPNGPVAPIAANKCANDVSLCLRIQKKYYTPLIWQQIA